MQELLDTSREVLESRNEIIRLQTEAIQGLVSLIVRHKGVDDVVQMLKDNGYTLNDDGTVTKEENN